MDTKDTSDYAEAGVDLEAIVNENPDDPTNKDAATPPPTEPVPEPESTPQPPADEPKVVQDEPLQDTPKEPRKRSIYDDYKEKKAEVKDWQALAVDALKARGVEVTGRETVEELRAKTQAVSDAPTPAARQEATDELEAFAQQINADPQVLRQMQEIFLKTAPGKTDPALLSRLEQFEEWSKSNAQVLEKQHFEQEWSTVAPTIKAQFPNASDAELNAIKAKVDELSHTRDWHDKDLDYVVFKNQATLAQMVSPKKPGLEPKGRVGSQDETPMDFNPNPDFSRMSAKEMEAWEQAYSKSATSNELITDTSGKRRIL